MIRFFTSKTAKKNLKDDKNNKESKSESLARSFREKSNSLLEFLSTKTEDSLEEFEIISEKLKNLEATNFNLGRLHIQKGNINEAIFRFRLMKLVYPHNFDAYYELAYCLTLKDKYAKAQKVLEELLLKKPDYHQRASALLQYLKDLQESKELK